MLLRAVAVAFPSDHIHVICASSTDFSSLHDLPNISVHKLSSKSSGEFGRLKHGVFGLRRMASDLGVDVIWSINLGCYRKGRIPQVISINNAYQAYPLGILRYHPAGVVRASVLRFFSLMSILASKGIVVQTKVMRSQLQNFVNDSRSIVVVPKAVESDADIEASELSSSVLDNLDCDRGKFTLLYVATAFPHKNHITVIDAIDQLRSRGMQVRLVLTLSSDEIAAIGGQAARRLIDEGYIVSVGWIAKEHLRALYDASDACVMPSLLESLSSAHLEAMAWGKPQIVSDLPYAHELCGDAAVYADPQSPSTWADQISSLISNNGHRARLVENGYSRMADYPRTWQVVAGTVRDFFEFIIAKQSS